MIDLVQIETTTACPAECPMCPRDVHQRGHGVMPTELFWRAVEQSVACGARHVLPFINGDPLADKRMVDFVECMAKTYPEVAIGWYTNAYLLTEEKAERLLRAGNLHHFNVSMQGATKEVFESNMKLPFEPVIANVEKLIEVNNRLGRPAEIRANMCVFSKTQSDVEAFVQKWQPLGCTICLGAYSNFGGMAHDEIGERPWKNSPRLVCDRATHHAYIYWNGDVGQCCFDLLGSVVYGNLATQTLADVLNSDKHRAMREAHKRIDVAAMAPICKECNACKFHG